MNNFNHWVKTQYGSKSGLLSTFRHKLLNSCGRYNRYADIRWDEVERLVFVCKGNICRSAYAEAVARSMGIEAISCGVEAIDGANANDEAINVAGRHGIDLRPHKTTPAKNVEIRQTDLMIAMEPWHIDDLSSIFGKQHQYTLLGLWGKPELPYLQDPFGYSLSYFDKCFSYIETCLKNISGKL